MKRIMSGFLVLAIFVFLFPVCTNATEPSEHISIIHLEDGSYIEITISEAVMRVTGTKSGKATYNYYDRDGALDWSAVLSGSFTYTGTTSICTSSSSNVTIFDSSWYVVSKQSGKNWNSATGTVTMGRKVLGITIEKETINMKLTCDVNGNLS